MRKILSLLVLLSNLVCGLASAEKCDLALLPHWQGPVLSVIREYETNERADAATPLNDEQRRAHTLTIEEGKFLNSSGEPYDTGSYARAVLVVEPSGRMIAVVDPVLDRDPSSFFLKYGHYPCEDCRFPKIYHSTLAREVVFAGTIEVKDGILTYLDNQSGHFLPSSNALIEFLQQLDSQGVDLSSANVHVLKFAHITATLETTNYDFWVNGADLLRAEPPILWGREDYIYDWNVHRDLLAFMIRLQSIMEKRKNSRSLEQLGESIKASQFVLQKFNHPF